MTFTINYELQKVTAIHPKTGRRSPAYLITPEYKFKHTYNGDRYEISYLVFTRDTILSLLDLDAPTAEHLETMREFFTETDLTSFPAIVSIDEFNHYGIEPID